MGFPGHFNIPGHSGTDFKHRKAFAKIKDYNRKRSSIDLPKIETEKDFKTSPQFSKKYQLTFAEKAIKFGFKLPLFLCFIIISFWVFNNFTNHYFSVINNSDKAYQTTVKEYKAKEKRENYDLFIRSGKSHLKANQLNFAQAEFIRALTIYKYAKEARVGLTLTLVEKCNSRKEFCQEAQDHILFLKKMKYLTEGELNALIDP